MADKQTSVELKFNAGDCFTFNEVPLFRTATYPSSHRVLTGKFFIFDGKEENCRLKVTASKSCVCYPYEVVAVEGWVEKASLLAGDKQ